MEATGIATPISRAATGAEGRRMKARLIGHAVMVLFLAAVVAVEMVL